MVRWRLVFVVTMAIVALLLFFVSHNIHVNSPYRDYPYNFEEVAVIWMYLCAFALLPVALLTALGTFLYNKLRNSNEP